VKAHVKVFINWKVEDGLFDLELVDNADFEWVTDSSINVLVPPTALQTISVVRITPVDQRVTQWQAGSPPTAFELTAADEQVLFVVQEFIDRVLATQGTLNFVISDGLTTVIDNLLSTSATAALSANQGRVLKALIDDLAAAIAGIGGGGGGGGGGGTTPLIDNLTSTSTTAALTANMGRALKELIDGISAITVIDALTSTNTTAALSANQGRALKALIDTLANRPVLPNPTTNGKVLKVVSGAWALGDDNVGSGTGMGVRILGTVPTPNPNYRYLRLTNIQVDSPDFFNPSEIQFRNVADAVVSGTWTTDIPLVFGAVGDLGDNNFSSAISAVKSDVTSSRYLQIDFGSPTVVAGMRHAVATEPPRQLKTFDLYGTNDLGTPFVKLGTFTLPSLTSVGVLLGTTFAFASVDSPGFGASTEGEIGYWPGNKKFYGCTASGTPGTWTLLN
jgi:hypothetical protein